MRGNFGICCLLAAMLCTSCAPASTRRAYTSDARLADKMILVVGEFCRVSRVVSDSSELPGYYCATVAEKEGSELYLLHDGTYFYAEWTDVTPLELVGRGTWRYEDMIVTLTPDKRDTSTKIDLKYLPIVRPGQRYGEKEIRLFGYPWYYEYYRDNLSEESDEVKSGIGQIFPGVMKKKAPITPQESERVHRKFQL